MGNWKEYLGERRKVYWAFIKWLLIALLVGVIVGFVGVLFHFAIEIATEYRMEHTWLIWLMPFGCVVIVLLYRLAGMEEDR